MWPKVAEGDFWVRHIEPARMRERVEAPEGAALTAEKAAMRARQARRRFELSLAAGRDAAGAARDHLLASFAFGPDQVIAAYWPLVAEFDARAMLRALHRRGHPCVLPVTGPRGSVLRFLRWNPETPLRLGRFGIPAPPGEGAEWRPEVLLVPLLAFDRRGHRLGWGGGYYDRTLRSLRADAGPRPLAIGVGFAGQEVARVPSGPNDAALDAIVSEAGAWRVASEDDCGGLS